MKNSLLILTCEHASHRIPRAYQKLFAGQGRLLASHRGWDLGARTVARALAKKFEAPLLCGKYSRLLVDLNRSRGNANVFSTATRALDDKERGALIAQYHQPYWRAAEGLMEKKISRGMRVVHVSVHSFTPTLYGKIRTAELGLLFDAKRKQESALCKKWQLGLKKALDFRVRRNYPYRGGADGLTTELRKKFPAHLYLGVELEINQACLAPKTRPLILIKALYETLAPLLKD